MEGIAHNFSEYYRYLEDIRRRLYSLTISFIIFFFVGFFCSGQILKLIIGTFRLQSAEIVTTSPFQFLDLAMSVGMYTGLVIWLPLFVYHLYGFLRDGLNRGEKRFFFLLLPAAVGLFLVGFAYGFAILYFTLDSIAAYNASLGISNLWDISKFLMQLILTSALLGVIFEYPMVLLFLIKVGLITPTFLREKRRHAIAAMFIFTSLLPPTDGLSLIIMVLPLIVIYEITIIIGAGIVRNRRVGSKARTAEIINQ